MARRIFISALAAAAAFAAFSVEARQVNLPSSVSVTLPDGMAMFDGPDADAINGNCLACHSRGMVLNQPTLPKAAWEAEVAKMRTVYKAPIDEKDVPEIVDYLVRVKGPK